MNKLVRSGIAPHIQAQSDAPTLLTQSSLTNNYRDSNLPELPIIAKPELSAKALNDEANYEIILQNKLETKVIYQSKEAPNILVEAFTAKSFPSELNDIVSQDLSKSQESNESTQTTRKRRCK